MGNHQRPSKQSVTKPPRSARSSSGTDIPDPVSSLVSLTSTLCKLQCIVRFSRHSTSFPARPPIRFCRAGDLCSTASIRVVFLRHTLTRDSVCAARAPCLRFAHASCVRGALDRPGQATFPVFGVVVHSSFQQGILSGEYRAAMDAWYRSDERSLTFARLSMFDYAN